MVKIKQNNGYIYGVNNENIFSSILLMLISSPEITSVNNSLWIFLGQCCPIELSVMIGMFYICDNAVATSHMWLLSNWNMASGTEKQLFYINLINHNFASMWNECTCVVLWTFFGIALLWDWNENWPFPVLWPLLSFSKFAGILSAALSQHHLSGFEIAQLEFHHLH